MLVHVYHINKVNLSWRTPLQVAPAGVLELPSINVCGIPQVCY